MLTKELTTPLKGKPYYRNVGIIKAYDRYGRIYSVGEIALERFDEQNFQYIITPYWEYIEFIPDGVFHGIPGIDMENNKQERYYRVNITPAFISMRTPSEQRENVKELMANVGLNYYDRFEWLLRSEAKCGDDNLFVVRKVSNEKQFYSTADIKYLNRDSVIDLAALIRHYKRFANNYIVRMYEIRQSGARIIDENGHYLTQEEINAQLALLKEQLILMDYNYRKTRQEGIEVAKTRGHYLGRKPISVDEELLNKIRDQFKSKMITEQEAMKELGIKSRSTFYRRMK